MGTRTGQQVVEDIKDHIGGRANGQIGSRGVDEACLTSVNKATRNCVKTFNPQELESSIEIAITAGTFEYAIPTSTVNSITASIKNIVSLPSLQLNNETTGTYLNRIYVHTLDKLEPYRDVNRTGRPYIYVIFSKNIILYPVPEDTYTLRMKVNLFPPDIILSQLTILDDIWNDAVEAYATFDVFAKLQQTQDAKTWYGIYKEILKETKGVLTEKPEFIADANMRDVDQMAGNRGLVGDPALNPLINRNY